MRLVNDEGLFRLVVKLEKPRPRLVVHEPYFTQPDQHMRNLVGLAKQKNSLNPQLKVSSSTLDS
jgi:hypothetical protein